MEKFISDLKGGMYKRQARIRSDITCFEKLIM